MQASKAITGMGIGKGKSVTHPSTQVLCPWNWWLYFGACLGLSARRSSMGFYKWPILRLLSTSCEKRWLFNSFSPDKGSWIIRYSDFIILSKCTSEKQQVNLLHSLMSLKMLSFASLLKMELCPYLSSGVLFWCWQAMNCQDWTSCHE